MPAGLRDRAPFELMVYSLVRIGAVTGMKVEYGGFQRLAAHEVAKYWCGPARLPLPE
jgi:hypothetical protein